MNHKLDSVQVLRAIAVLLVVYAHSFDASLINFGPSFQSGFHHLDNWGAIGLDLFFIISGFIMTRIVSGYQKPGGAKTFIAKRVIRIIPLYWSLSAIALLLLLRKSPVDMSRVVKTILFFPTNESLFVFPLIDVGWSLSFEMYFYLLISLLLFLRVKQLPQLLSALLIALSLAGALLNPPFALPKFLTSPFLLEFAMGCLAGIGYDMYNPQITWQRTTAIAFLIVGGLGMVSTVFTGYGNLSEADVAINSNIMAFQRALVWGIPCGLFLVGFILMERTYSLSMPAWLVAVGDASFSNYLLHTLVIIYSHKTVLRLNLLNSDTYVWFMVLFCTLCSLLLYRFGEKPLTDYLNRVFFPKKQVSVTKGITA